MKFKPTKKMINQKTPNLCGISLDQYGEIWVISSSHGTKKEFNQFPTREEINLFWEECINYNSPLLNELKEC